MERRLPVENRNIITCVSRIHTYSYIEILSYDARTVITLTLMKMRFHKKFLLLIVSSRKPANRSTAFHDESDTQLEKASHRLHRFPGSAQKVSRVKLISGISSEGNPRKIELYSTVSPQLTNLILPAELLNAHYFLLKCS